jgi:hypothetical protein
MTCKDCAPAPAYGSAQDELVGTIVLIIGMAITLMALAFNKYMKEVALPDVGDNTTRLAAVHHHRGWHHHESAQHKARAQESDSVGQDDEPYHDDGSSADHE